MQPLKICKKYFHLGSLVGFLLVYMIALTACKNSTVLERLTDSIKREGKGSKGAEQSEAGRNNDRPSESTPSVPGYYMFCIERALPPQTDKVSYACGLTDGDLNPTRPANLHWNLRFSPANVEVTSSKSEVSEPGPIVVTFDISFPSTVNGADIVSSIILEATFSSTLDGETKVLASRLSEALSVVPQPPKDLVDKLEFTASPFSMSLSGQKQWHTGYDGASTFRNYLYYRLFPVFPATLSEDEKKLIRASKNYIERQETFKSRFSLDYDATFFAVRDVPYPGEYLKAWELITKKPGQTSVRASFDQKPFEPYDYNIVAYTSKQTVDGHLVYIMGVGSVPSCTSCHKEDDLYLTTVLYLPIRSDAELIEGINAEASHNFNLSGPALEGAFAAYIRSLVSDVGTRWDAFYKASSK